MCYKKSENLKASQIIYNVLEITCGVPPSALSSSHQFFKSLYRPGEQVTYNCVQGHWYTRGVTSFNLTCTLSGMWSVLQPACKCEMFL